MRRPVAEKYLWNASKKSSALSAIAVATGEGPGYYRSKKATLLVARTTAESISDAYLRSEALREIADGIIAVTKAVK